MIRWYSNVTTIISCNMVTTTKNHNDFRPPEGSRDLESGVTDYYYHYDHYDHYDDDDDDDDADDDDYYH